MAGHPAKFLLDTGAKSCVVSQRLVEAAKLPEEEADAICFQFANGARSASKTTVTGELKIPGFQGSTVFRTYNLPARNYDAILGLDWFRKTKPVIDWAAGKIQFQPAATTEINLISWAKVQAEDEAELFWVTPDAETQEPSKPEVAKLPEELQQEFQELLVDELPDKLPPIRAVNHAIKLQPGAEAPKCRPYRMSPVELQEVKRQLEILQAKGLIAEAVTPFGAPVLLVKKQDGTMRMCVDFRKLNQVTVKDSYPLPVIEDVFNTLAKARWFTKLDLASGYHQVRIQPGDEAKTAFATRYGTFTWKVMPFENRIGPVCTQFTANRADTRPNNPDQG